MSQADAILIIGGLLGFLQILGLYWIKRVDGKFDELSKTTVSQGKTLTAHHYRLIQTEGACGIDTPAPEVG